MIYQPGWKHVQPSLKHILSGIIRPQSNTRRVLQMKLTVKKIMSLLLVSVLLISLVGCGKADDNKVDADDKATTETKTNNGESDVKAAEKPTIKYYTNTDEAPLAERLAAEFTETTGIGVEVNSYPAKEYYDKMLLLLTAGEQVDLFMTGHTPKIMQFYEAETLEPLNDYIEKANMDLSVFGEGHTKYQFDGEYYSLPSRRVVWLMYANMDILNEKGVEIPENMTWEQYIDVAASLTSGEGDDKVFGGQWVQWGRLIQLVQTGKNVFDDDLSMLQQELEFSNKVMNIDNSFMDYGQMSEGGGDYLSWFLKGQTATMINGEWAVSGMKARIEKDGLEPVNWKAFPMPISEGVAPYSTAGNYSDLSINVESQYKEETFQFLEFVISKESGIEMAKDGRIPSNLSEEALDAYIGESDNDSMRIILDMKINEFLPGLPGAAAIAGVIGEESELYLIGAQTIEEAMEHIYERRAIAIEDAAN